MNLQCLVIISPLLKASERIALACTEAAVSGLRPDNGSLLGQEDKSNVGNTGVLLAVDAEPCTDVMSS